MREKETKKKERLKVGEEASFQQIPQLENRERKSKRRH